MKNCCKFNLNYICLFCFSFAICDSNVHYINWSLATDRGSTHRERDYNHPAYIEVAVSACDLTENFCDVNCCSDQDCSAEEKDSFNCVGGLPDGQKTDSLISENCKHLSEYPAYGWLHFLCYVINNTPYLGEYFITEKKVDTLLKFRESLSYKKDVFNFPSGIIPKESETDSFTTYKYGSPIKMVLNSDGVLVRKHKYLQMPSHVFSSYDGMCADNVAVRFLVNREAHCIRAVSKYHCEEGINSPLSVQKYFIADGMINTTFTKSEYLYVAKDVFGREATPTQVKFLCFRNSSDYITFSNNVLKFDLSEVPISATVLEYSEPSLVECSDSEIENLTLFYDGKEETCRNVLISLVYDFTWNGTDIVNLIATYIISDVPLTPYAFVTSESDTSTTDLYTSNSFTVHNSKATELVTELFVSQHFTSKFRHCKPVKMSEDNVTLLEEETISYSGNPGYEIGSPVISLHSNGSSFKWEEAVFAVWKSDGACEGMTSVEFGYDVITTCRLEIDTVDFEDCDALRERVLFLQESLMSGEVVSPGGAILRSGLNMTYAEELVPILKVLPTNKSDLEEDILVGKCANIPVKHNTDILYTTVSDPGPMGRPIHRIVGVRTGYGTANWNLESSSQRQAVVLTSVVIFIPVPLVDERPKSRFWERMTSPEESETAWRNLFQIMDEFVTGDEILEMSAYGIVLLALGVALLILLRKDL